MLKNKDQKVTPQFPPEYLVIPHDDHHGKYVGITRYGIKFFITTPFTFHDKQKFVACYLFHPDGSLKEAIIDQLGSRSELIGKDTSNILPLMPIQPNQTTEELIQVRLDQLGSKVFKSISIKPFSIEKYGTTFGLIPDYPYDPREYDTSYVVLMPGNYMAFHWPWNGEYDT